jgi:lipopolysaccharide transport system ATP-binding protein
MTTAIKVENLSKWYRLGANPVGTFNLSETIKRTIKGAASKVKQLFNPMASLDEHGFYALNKLNFEVQTGEVLGVIGRNGAGKSTLLKILSRITAPTTGKIEIRGRMGSLLEVGAGFHPELTGRENVYLNGSILGMTRNEIRSKFNAIVDFAECSDFLDTPVKRYSSGMFVRLAFAVAAHLEPEIMVVDEVLAVGDATFQKRCIDRMTELAHQGRTILFVSHNMQLIPQFCQKAIMLQRGQIVQAGESGEVTKYYMDRLLADTRTGDLADKTHTGCGRARFVRAGVVDNEGRVLSQFVSGSDFIVRMEMDVKQPVEDVSLAVVVQSVFGTRVITSWNREVNFSSDLRPGRQAFECRFQNVRLRPGHTVMVNLWSAEGHDVIDAVDNAVAIDVVGSEKDKNLSTASEQGVFICDYEWREVMPGMGSGELSLATSSATPNSAGSSGASQ